MYEKISKKKTLHYVIHKNAWALYFILIVSSCINWDIFITKYNITADVKNGIDASFIIKDVSNKNIYLLLEQKDLILKSEANKKYNLEQMIENKKASFLRKQKRYSWFSWNLPDWRNRKVVKME